MKAVRMSLLVAAVLCSIVSVVSADAGSGDATSASLDGSWLGTARISPTTSLRAVFSIRAHASGSCSGTFLSPDQSAAAVPLSRISLADGWVTIEMGVIGARYEGIMNAEASAISGRWTQGGFSCDLPLHRRRQEPKRPYPYLDEEVTYRNETDDATFAGTLTMPSTGGPFPVVILITGSGQEDRDESAFGHRPFWVLADYLTCQGIAVLRVDDRGVGGTTGDASQATSADFARDVLAGVDYLKTRRDIDPNRIGLVGHSEGGIIAPLAAVDSNDVAFLVLMAGPGVPGDLVTEGQILWLLKAAGADQARIDATLQQQRRVIDVVKTVTDPLLAQERLRDLGCADAQIPVLTSKWFYYFVTHDPQETLRKVRCPVLAINGGLDTQVLALVNLPAIEQALRAGGNPDFTVQELPGLNHLFQTAQTGGIDEYAKIEETMSPTALETVAAWIEARTKQK